MTLLRLHRLTDVRQFLDLAGAFLAEHEAENNLLLGLTTTLLHNPTAFGPAQPYFGVVSDAGSVLAAALMTPPNQAVLAWSTHDEAVHMLAGDVWTFRPDTPGVHGPRPTGAWFGEAWDRLTSLEPVVSTKERIYKLERVRPVTGVAGSMRRATDRDLPLLAEWTVAFQAEALPQRLGPFLTAPEFLTRWRSAPPLAPEQGGHMLWEVDDRPVSYARFGGATPHGLRIGPVYTPPEYRRRGFASALVAGISQLILGLGRRYVFLYTDLANPTSNHLYQEIGFEPVCDVDEYRFGE